MQRKELTCYLWSHYHFKQFLQHKALEATHPCYVIIQNESYTAKACGRFGKINSNIGANEIFCCVHCGYKTDRDVHGARNILRKYLGHFRGWGNSTVVSVSVYQASGPGSFPGQSACIRKVEFYHCAIDSFPPVLTTG